MEWRRRWVDEMVFGVLLREDWTLINRSRRKIKISEIDSDFPIFRPDRGWIRVFKLWKTKARKIGFRLSFRRCGAENFE